MRSEEIRAILEAEAHALVPEPPNLWPRVEAALARQRRGRPARLRRWLGVLGALVMAAAALGLALLQPGGGAAPGRSVSAAWARPVPALAAAPTDWRRSPTPTPSADPAAVVGPRELWPLTPVALPVAGLARPAALPSPPGR